MNKPLVYVGMWVVAFSPFFGGGFFGNCWECGREAVVTRVNLGPNTVDLAVYANADDVGWPSLIINLPGVPVFDPGSQEVDFGDPSLELGYALINPRTRPLPAAEAASEDDAR